MENTTCSDCFGPMTEDDRAIKIRIPGCPFCGGGECRDSGEWEYLCASCRRECAKYYIEGNVHPNTRRYFLADNHDWLDAEGLLPAEDEEE